MSERGFSEKDTFVLYDNSDRFTASCRAFWVFKCMDVESVFVLDGGMDAWKQVAGVVETGEEVLVSRSVLSRVHPN